MIKSNYGRWKVDKDRGLLTIDISPIAPYDIPLDDMMSSARILDWIFQIQEKTWSTSSDVGDLVEAIRDIFGRNFCGGFEDEKIDARSVISKRLGTIFL